MSPLEVYNPGLHDFIAPDAPIERVANSVRLNFCMVAELSDATVRDG